MKQEKRMIKNYEIIQAINVGDKEVVIGVNSSKEAADNEETFMCAYCESNELFEQCTEGMASNDYLEIMKLFCERSLKEIEAVQTERAKITEPMPEITADMCLPRNYDQDILGKVMVVSPCVLRYEYRTAAYQLVLVTYGNGARANAIGRSCFCTELYSCKDEKYDCHSFIGEIKPELMPEWAKKRLAEMKQKSPDAD